MKTNHSVLNVANVVAASIAAIFMSAIFAMVLFFAFDVSLNDDFVGFMYLIVSIPAFATLMYKSKMLKFKA